VGDDWQSIYGFRGSNVSYIVEFEKHFKNTEVLKLNLNYRSTQNIVGASNEVIKHNKFKVEKELVASRISENKIVVFSGNDDKEDNVNFCLSEIQRLLNRGFKEDEILFLYRRTKMFVPYRDAFNESQFKIHGKTIHASKGLEARVVFLIGLTEGDGGFPDIWLNDRIFQVIKRADYDLLMEEERRLFYVALTRASERLYLITEKSNPSSFLKEIPDIYTTKTHNAAEAIIERVETCKKCSAMLESIWKVCPFCGETI
jgi:superfamily I DNA/RNA helicase